MKKLTQMLCIGAVAAVAVQGESAPPQRELALSVTAGNVSGVLLAQARVTAAAILAQAGIRVRWTSRNGVPVASCAGAPVDVSQIDILIADHSRPEDHPGALGYALPFSPRGVRVVIFYDRVVAWTPLPSAQLLGHVIAHEVGHMLLGTLSHAPSGLMEPHWSKVALRELELRPLAFTPGDAAMIAGRLEQQARVCAGKSLLARADAAPGDR